MSRIVIQSHAGGLGDNLLYSTLPELYTKFGHDVFISTRMPFRNLETRALVWESNPFVLGFVNEPHNAGENEVWKMVKHSPRNLSPIERVEIAHGFEPTHRFPRIYYTPKYMPEWSGRIIGDATAISQTFPPSEYEDFVRYIGRFNPRFPAESMWMLHSKHEGYGIAFPDNPQHMVESIFEYCDIIYSSSRFFGVESGGTTLASAIRASTGSYEWPPPSDRERTPHLYALATTMGFNERIFMWDNVHYVVTGTLTPTYRIWE